MRFVSTFLIAQMSVTTSHLTIQSPPLLFLPPPTIACPGVFQRNSPDNARPVTVGRLFVDVSRKDIYIEREVFRFCRRESSSPLPRGPIVILEKVVVDAWENIERRDTMDVSDHFNAPTTVTRVFSYRGREFVPS